MTDSLSDPNSVVPGGFDREGLGAVLALQRAAYRRDGAPSLAKRRNDLDKLKTALLARRVAFEVHVGQDDLPFGGVGESGMGKYHGIEGFRTLSHPKGIYEQGRWNATALLRAPSVGARMCYSDSSSAEAAPAVFERDP